MTHTDTMVNFYGETLDIYADCGDVDFAEAAEVFDGETGELLKAFAGRGAWEHATTWAYRRGYRF